MPDRVKNQRRSPRQARSRATYDAILEAAAQILDRDGPRAFNTNAVAERAGVSVGTLYQYFPDKEAVLLAAARREFSGIPLLSRQQALLQALIGIVDSIGRLAGGTDKRTVTARVIHAVPGSAAKPARRAPGRGSRLANAVQEAMINGARILEPLPIPVTANSHLVVRRRG